MDPALYELCEGAPGDEISAIIRLNNPEILPPGVRVISRFGDVATVRLARGEIHNTHNHENVRSLKAPRTLFNPSYVEDDLFEPDETGEYLVQRPDIPETGSGVVIGIIDIGCDFAHPDFIAENGQSRIHALWLQKGASETTDQNPYGRGRIILNEEINQALASADPYETLDCHPGEVAPDGGAHGTHTMGIAAGNGLGSGVPGIAPKAQIIFVQADSGGLSGLNNFGDSVSILEAIDFIIHHATGKSIVINISMGRCGGPHDGFTLFEIAADSAMLENPGLVIVNSTGNYRQFNVHSSGQIETGKTHSLTWIVDPSDQTPNELEVWYSGHDQMRFKLVTPDREVFGPVEAGDKKDIVINGELIGRIYHRAKDPNNGKNHLDCFLFENSPTGDWEVFIEGIDVHDGSFNGWIERDAGNKSNQSRFAEKDAVLTGTTGTIANSHLGISVGAYDARTSDRVLADFSSAGPTVDNRQKPELVAPGVRVLAPSSAPLDSIDAPLLTEKSGTSMAAPHVAGSIALLMEAVGRKITIQEVRNCLLGSADDIPTSRDERYRLGNGYLNIIETVKRGRAISDKQTSVKKNIHDIFTHDNQLLQLEEMTMDYEQNDDITVDPNLYFDSGFDNESYSYALQHPATVYDSLLNFQTPHFEQTRALYETVVKPGEIMTDDLRAGDILIERVLGEGALARSTVLENLPVTLVGKNRLGHDSMILRPRDHEGSSHNLSSDFQSDYIGVESLPLERLYPSNISSIEVEPISAAALGLAVLQAGLAVGTSGNFSFTSRGATYIHNKTPAHVPLDRAIVDFKIKANHPDLASSHPVFWFNLEFDYNGFDIMSCKITHLRKKSDALRVSDFDINFHPFEYSGKFDPVCIIRYEVSGSWNPFGFGDVTFKGNLYISAEGKYSFEFHSEKETFLYKKAYVHQPKFSNVIRKRLSTPPPPMPTVRQLFQHIVYFKPKGSFKIDGPTVRNLQSWYMKLPYQTRKNIEEGQEVIKLTGFASTLDEVDFNHDLATKRVENVRSYLSGFASNQAKFVTKIQGELSAKTDDGVDDPREQRVEILVVGPRVK